MCLCVREREREREFKDDLRRESAISIIHNSDSPTLKPTGWRKHLIFLFLYALCKELRCLFCVNLFVIPKERLIMSVILDSVDLFTSDS